MSRMKDRVRIAKKAVKAVRDKMNYPRFPERSLITTTPKEWSIGLIGLLDYVYTGDPKLILLPELRAEVAKMVKE